MAESEKRKRGRPAKVIVPHTLPETFDTTQNSAYIKLYYDKNHNPLPLETIAKRIAEADSSINKSIAQTALDIFFVRSNWATTYSRDKSQQFKTWLEETIPFSRAYSLDLLKCVKELVKYKSGENAKELDDAVLATVHKVFENNGIGVLREIIHAPDDVRDGYVERLLNGEEIPSSELKEIKKTKQPKTNKVKHLVNHKLTLDGKVVLSLDALAKSNPNLAEKIENAIEKVYRIYLKNPE